MMIFKHGQDFFTKDKESHRGVDLRESMEDAVRVEGVIRNKIMDMGMPY